MPLRLITPPSVEPVTQAEAKLHLRVDVGDENDLIDGLIQAAREYCEGYQNRAYLEQTWELVLDEWPRGDIIPLPKPPLKSVTTVTYIDSTGAETVWPAANYIVDTASARLALAYGRSWPSVTLQPRAGIVIRYVVGKANPGEGESADVPQRVKQAMLLLIGHWFTNREAVLTGSISKEVEFAVHALLGLDRVVPI
jgi:uncharacterized phiE125 gp8 family phage protein